MYGGRDYLAYLRYGAMRLFQDEILRSPGNFWSRKKIYRSRIPINIARSLMILSDAMSPRLRFSSVFFKYFSIGYQNPSAITTINTSRPTTPPACTPVKKNKPVGIAPVENYTSGDPRSQVQHIWSLSNFIILQCFYCSPVEILKIIPG